MNNTELYELFYLNSARDDAKEIMNRIMIIRDHLMDSAGILAVHKGEALTDLGEAYDKVKSAMLKIENCISTIRF